MWILPEVCGLGIFMIINTRVGTVGRAGDSLYPSDIPHYRILNRVKRLIKAYGQRGANFISCLPRPPYLICACLEGEGSGSEIEEEWLSSVDR